MASRCAGDLVRTRGRAWFSAAVATTGVSSTTVASRLSTAVVDEAVGEGGVEHPVGAAAASRPRWLPRARKSPSAAAESAMTRMRQERHHGRQVVHRAQRCVDLDAAGREPVAAHRADTSSATGDCVSQHGDHHEGQREQGHHLVRAHEATR